MASGLNRFPGPATDERDEIRRAAEELFEQAEADAAAEEEAEGAAPDTAEAEVEADKTED